MQNERKMVAETYERSEEGPVYQRTADGEEDYSISNSPIEVGILQEFYRIMLQFKVFKMDMLYFLQPDTDNSGVELLGHGTYCSENEEEKMIPIRRFISN
jgi:hypothetical protein